MAGERLINYIQQIRGLLNPFSATVIRLGDKQATDLKTPPSSEAAAYLLEEDNVIFVESRGTANFKIGEIPITIKDTKRGAHVVVGNEEAFIPSGKLQVLPGVPGVEMKHNYRLSLPDFLTATKR